MELIPPEPFISSRGFLLGPNCLSVSNRGAIVKQLVGKPAGIKPEIYVLIDIFIPY